MKTEIVVYDCGCSECPQVWCGPASDWKAFEQDRDGVTIIDHLGVIGEITGGSDLERWEDPDA